VNSNPDAAAILTIANRMARANGVTDTASRLMHVACMLLVNFGVAPDYITHILGEMNREIDADDRGVRH